MVETVKHCRNCIMKGQFQDGSWGCGLSKQPIDLDRDFCSKYMDEPYVCDNCNSIIPFANQVFVVEKEEDSWIKLCANCVNIWRNENINDGTAKEE